jgi:thiol:disulfide interchange protein DsbA
MKTLLARLAIVLALVAGGAAAQTQPVAGRDYQSLNPPRPVSSGASIEVIEFFYYGCPVCYESQPHIARWLLRSGPGIAMERVPAVFTESSESFARTFYALAALDQIGRLHWPLYDNHHFDGKQLNEEKNVLAWVSGNGVDGKRFQELWHSAEVKERIDAAKKALDLYGIRGVPTFVIDGKYVTSARMAGGVKEMMQVVEFLVNRARAERKK